MGESVIRSVPVTPRQRAAVASARREDPVLGDPPDHMDTAEIRAIVAAHTAPSKKTVDIERIPFGVELELEGFDMDDAEEFIDEMPAWNVNRNARRWKLDEDASLDGGGEAVSPAMRLEGGEAEKQIRQVLKQLHKLGGRTSKNCGLHIHVDASVLGKTGLSNLMKISLDAERLLYRLSQNGHRSHRGLRDTNDPFYYCQPYVDRLEDPFPLLHAPNHRHFRNAFYEAHPDGDGDRPELPDVDSDEPFTPPRRDPARYHGINFNSYWYRGTIEFRLFDATDDPEQVMTSIRLALNVIKAAAENRYHYTRPTGLGKKAIPRELYEYFLSTIAPDNDLRRRLEKTFNDSGGKLAEDKPVTDPTVISAAAMLKKGFHFSAEDASLSSAFEIAEVLDSRTVRLKAPSGRSFDLESADDLDRVQERFSRRYQQRVTAAVDSLLQRGYRFSMGDEVLDSATPALIDAVWNGGLQMRPGGGWTCAPIPIPKIEFLERFTRLSRAQQQLACDTWRLMQAGYTVHLPKTGSRATVSGLLALAEPQQTVRFTAPSGSAARSGSHPTAGRGLSVETGTALQTAITAELNPAALPDEASRHHAQVGEWMAAHGYPLLDRDGGALPTRAAAVLHYGSLFTRVHGSAPIPVAARTMECLFQLDTGHVADADPEADRALTLNRSLRATGCNVVHRVNGAANAVEDADLLLLLNADVAVEVVDPTGASVPVRGTQAFIDHANRQVAIHDDSQNARKPLLDGLRALAEAGHVVVRSTANGHDDAPAVETQQVPWLLARDQALTVAAPTAPTASAFSTPIANWDALQRFVDVETAGQGGDATALPASTRQILNNLRTLKDRGMQLSFVTRAQRWNPWAKPVPITLTSQAVDRLDTEGVRVHLPRWTWWNHFPRRTVHVRGHEELQRLTAKVSPPAA